MEVEKVAVEIGLQVDFGRETAARVTKCLALLPPFAPAAETWARAVAVSKNRPGEPCGCRACPEFRV